MRIVIVLPWLLLGLLAGCAAPPARDAGPTPAEVAASGRAAAPVHWGGYIVRVRNLRERTLIEVLSLPLASDGRPRASAPPQGRFIIEQPGFLEPHEYAAERLVEVEGRLDGFTDGRVGESPYRYPVVLAERLVLWPPRAAAGYREGPRINFGFGVGSSGSGVGVGVGF